MSRRALRALIFLLVLLPFASSAEGTLIGQAPLELRYLAALSGGLDAGLTTRTGLPPLPLGLRGTVSGALHWTGRWNADHAAGAFDQSWEVDAAATIALR